MSVGDEQQVDRKYLEVAGHLKACWTFEQFHRRLQRSPPESAASADNTELGSAYDDLKQLAAEFDLAERQSLEPRLADLESRLRRAAARLSEEDSKLSPADLRRFVGRVRRLDEEVLLGLLRFYVFASRGKAWDADLTDKVDFLVSRLGEEVSGPLLKQDRARLNASLLQLWRLALTPPPNASVLLALRTEIEKVAAHMSEFANLEELQASGTIARYRKIKHGLGAMFIEPSIIREILRTNLALSRKVQQLYDKEEWAIAADFSRLAEAEETSGFSEFLSIEVDSLRREMELLGEGRLYDDVRIDTVRRLREQAEVVLTQLGPRHELDGSFAATASDEGFPADAPEEGVASPATGDRLAADLLQRLFGHLETLLVASGTVEAAEAVLQDPGLPFDLERCEVEAYLRLRDESSRDPEFHRLLLTAAALRLRLSILHDHLAAGSSGLVELEAAAALELAQQLLDRFRALVVRLESPAPTAESTEVRFLEVRLMHHFSSLWLEVNSGGG